MMDASTDSVVPAVLLIDDELEDVRGHARNLCDTTLVSARALPPEDVTPDDLTCASVVLVDYKLDNWPERDRCDARIARKPPDGLAVAATLRQHLSDHSSPTAFGLLTARMGQVAGQLPADYRNHAVAAAYNLEWVFEKKDARLYDQIQSLANAMAQLPQKWSSDSDGQSPGGLMRYLGIDKGEEDADVLTRDVEKCLPPVHALSEWSHGLAVVRWLLHRILPYPCFLWDMNYLACRLRVQSEDLDEALKPGTELHGEMSRCEYCGNLKDFLGTRWWRSRVELLLWEKTDGQSFDARAVREVVSALAGRELPPTSSAHPVVCLDERGLPAGLVDITESVRLQPDDWPPYADQAWTSIELAQQSPALRALVLEEDREGLK